MCECKKNTDKDITECAKTFDTIHHYYKCVCAMFQRRLFCVSAFQHSSSVPPAKFGIPESSGQRDVSFEVIIQQLDFKTLQTPIPSQFTNIFSSLRTKSISNYFASTMSHPVVSYRCHFKLQFILIFEIPSEWRTVTMISRRGWMQAWN